MLSFSSCSEPFDDSEIWDKLEEYGDAIKDHENRIAALEELCRQMNTNISSLQALVEALQKNDYITGITPISKEGKTVGYTITFALGEPITIYHGQDGKDGADGKDGQDGEDGKDGADGKDGEDGKDGKDGQDGKDGKDGQDGSTPVIGVRQDSDGVYYWTLNGEWLTDENGNKIATVRVEVVDGDTSVIPRLKIENDYWYISYDNGATWDKLGKATGENGKDGQDGKDGKDGVDGKDGKDGVDGKDGKDGVDGKDGEDGKDGVDGKDGEDGKDGIDGKDGEDGKDGVDGKDGEDGKDGVNGTDGKDGKDGVDGKDGKDGQDGDSMFSSVTYDVNNVYFTLADGTVLTLPRASGESAVNPNAKIYYTTVDGKKLFPSNNHPNNFGAILVSSSYSNGQGVMIFDDAVTAVGDSAFYDCTKLTSITLPNSVTEIGTKAFYGCSSLASFNGKFASADNRCLVVEGELTAFAPAGVAEYAIPSGVTAIGERAMANIPALTKVTIPSGVTSIGYGAFSGCEELAEIYCKATTLPAGAMHMFEGNASGRVIYVPSAAFWSYRAAEFWSDYKASIKVDPADPMAAFSLSESGFAAFEASKSGNVVTLVSKNASNDEFKLVLNTVDGEFADEDGVAYTAGAGQNLSGYYKSASYGVTFNFTAGGFTLSTTATEGSYSLVVANDTTWKMEGEGFTYKVTPGTYAITVSGNIEDTPEPSGYTMIDRVANLTAGTYYVAAYCDKDSGNKSLAPYIYHFFNGSVDSGSLTTSAAKFANGELTIKDGEAEMVAVVLEDAGNGKYYLKSAKDGKYVKSTSAEKHKLALTNEKYAWTATDNDKGGIALTDGSVWVGSASATKNFIRSYDAESKLKFGLYFFK